MKRFSAGPMRRAAAALTLVLLSGCTVQGGAQPTAAPPSSPTAVASPPPATPSPTAPATPISVSQHSDLKAALRRAMEGLSPALEVDVAALDLGAEPENLVRNLYYELLGETPELKYTFDITTIYDPVGQTMDLTFSYMPFKTGTQTKDATLAPVDTLSDLISTAQRGLGADTVGIYITNPDLNVETMALALGQVGGGYVVCGLNQDATALLFSPTNGRTMEACLDYLAQTDALADAVLSQVCTPAMTQEEKLAAVYDYLTGHVRYDQRYYTDPENMPYESITAYGAFQDGLAICGGYALSLQLLTEKIGLRCYTVNGVANGEYHMWNLIRVEDRWQFYDATYDRGSAEFGYRWFGVKEAELENTRTWNQSLVHALISE